MVPRQASHSAQTSTALSAECPLTAPHCVWYRFRALCDVRKCGAMLTLLQPPASAVVCFDRIVALDAKGRISFDGPPVAAAAFFEGRADCPLSIEAMELLQRQHRLSTPSPMRTKSSGSSHSGDLAPLKGDSPGPDATDPSQPARAHTQSAARPRPSIQLTEPRHSTLSEARCRLYQHHSNFMKFGRNFAEFC